MSHRSQGPEGPTQASQLAELLACERELGELLARAEEEARQRVEEARAAASKVEADLEALLEEEAQHARTRIHEETQGRLREILAQARAQVARFEGVSDDRVRVLADSAFRRLIAPDGH